MMKREAMVVMKHGGFRNYNPKTKVMALSMHSERHFVAGMLAAGASGYLLKDCAFEDLVSSINTVAKGEIYLSPKISKNVMTDYLQPFSEPTPLTSRQKEVLHLLAEGGNIRDISEKLNLSVKTVEMHRKNIMTNLGFNSMADLIKYAIKEGLTSLD